MSMKPILFNTEMVHAIQSGTKTVTRRVVRPRYCDSVFELFGGKLCEASPYKPPIDNGDGTTTNFVRLFSPCKPPYHPGDILYVRETWYYESHMEDMTTGEPDLPSGAYSRRYIFKANCPDYPVNVGVGQHGWRPSIHMPREAARIFLRVTDVRAERLQSITEEQARAEGAEPFMMTTDVDKPDNEKRWEEKLPALVSFSGIWNSTIKPADRALYGWDANPWVWVIEFERCERPKE